MRRTPVLLFGLAACSTSPSAGPEPVPDATSGTATSVAASAAPTESVASPSPMSAAPTVGVSTTGTTTTTGDTTTGTTSDTTSDTTSTGGTTTTSTTGSTTTSTTTSTSGSTTTSTSGTATTFDTTSTSGTRTTGTNTGTTTSTTTGTTVPWPRTVTIAFTGDTLPHSPLWRQAERNAGRANAYDFAPMLAGLAPMIEPVDLAVCHLETPIAPLGEEFSTSPFYGVPAEIADALAAAGYDRCSTASNHTADRGTAGVERTVDVLESRGLGQSGMARHPAEIEPQVFAVNGVAITHLSYTFSYNGLTFPPDEQWRSAVIDPERIVADARAARRLGATIVFVSLHWGAEGVSTPTYGQRTIAEEITAGDEIDLVVGHHAHVVQPVEQVNDTWVLFGLGNILSNLPTSNRWPAASQDAVVATVEVVVDQDGDVAVGRPELAATWVDKDAGWLVRLVDHELASADLSAGQRGRLEGSRARTAAVVGAFMTTADPQSGPLRPDSPVANHRQ